MSETPKVRLPLFGNRVPIYPIGHRATQQDYPWLFHGEPEQTTEEQPVKSAESPPGKSGSPPPSHLVEAGEEGSSGEKADAEDNDCSSSLYYPRLPDVEPPLDLVKSPTPVPSLTEMDIKASLQKMQTELAEMKLTVNLILDNVQQLLEEQDTTTDTQDHPPDQAAESQPPPAACNVSMKYSEGEGASPSLRSRRWYREGVPPGTRISSTRKQSLKVQSTADSLELEELRKPLDPVTSSEFSAVLDSHRKQKQRERKEEEHIWKGQDPFFHMSP